VPTIIRSMRPTDLEPATQAILRDDWGDRRAWFEFTLAQDTCHPFVATLDDRIVGTGVGVRSGRAGWIGAVWVAPDRRRHGLGRALTEAVISALIDGGVRTLVLVSTEAGGPLYERLGFAIDTWYEILESPGTSDPAPANVRPFRRGDLAAMAGLDALATGEDRASVLRRFASPSTARVVTARNAGGQPEVHGFVVRAPWGGGATIAPSADDAMALLEARRAAAGPTGRVRVGILRENQAGRARLEALGLRPAWSAPRMVRGEPLDWHPDWIWGQFNHAMG
jgi:GNAT superfamily N-acetyltransferase